MLGWKGGGGSGGVGGARGMNNGGRREGGAGGVGARVWEGGNGGGGHRGELDQWPPPPHFLWHENGVVDDKVVIEFVLEIQLFSYQNVAWFF